MCKARLLSRASQSQGRSHQRQRPGRDVGSRRGSAGFRLPFEVGTINPHPVQNDGKFSGNRNLGFAQPASFRKPNAALLLEHTMEGGIASSVAQSCIVGSFRMRQSGSQMERNNRKVQQHAYIEARHASRVPARDTAWDGSERGRGEPDQPCTNHHPAPGRSPLGFEQELPRAQRGYVSAVRLTYRAGAISNASALVARRSPFRQSQIPAVIPLRGRSPGP